ncbi:transmembrane protein, putative (macronuclear) [Tetrahymena thermophila SB210]|uniref:Transmembrane protein, putative n=1 Tax=Tetrahymena thermophila (strain SB210) TaxID=312017 RepID=Q23QQ5_TETTS|nr:transmembrane protein, putative [Tetrahymena thermophila SB210]EAR98833.2 transmembrane protein, putative [Tetrahymena thermophila SB210]|eukprot:XP_001019078.2 transmembrane protein, putative [Tetrahymena thermophila SB210]
MQNINILLTNLDDLLLSETQQTDQIFQILSQLDYQLLHIQNEDYQKYGYYQYLIAEKCLNSLTNISENYKSRYKEQLNTFKKQYDQYQNNFVQQARRDLSSEQNQLIEYKIQLQEVQKNQGCNGIFNILGTTLNLYKIENTIKSVGNASKAIIAKSNVITTLGLTAIETCKIYYDYLKLRSKCLNEGQIRQAKTSLKQQLKALGARSVCSSIISTGATALGLTIAALISPAAGAIALGGVLGAIVGGICSYFVQKQYIDPYFLEEQNYIIECERLLGLEDFRQANQGIDYTKEEFDFKYKRSLLNEHPDKQTTDTMRANARHNIFKIQLAKEMIYKHRGWQ